MVLRLVPYHHITLHHHPEDHDVNPHNDENFKSRIPISSPSNLTSIFKDKYTKRLSLVGIGQDG
jgi:hypothetical protein